jgi:putative hemolysin
MSTVLLFIVLIALSAFFAASETAFFTLHQAQVIAMQRRRRRNADLIFRLKSHPQQLLITILIGNNIVNIFTASLATVLVVDVFGSAGIGIATGVTTLVLLIFGEIIPKSYAQIRNKQLAQLFALPVFFAYVLFWPVARILVMVDDLIGPDKKVNQITQEEVKAMSKLGLRAGSIHPLEDKFVEKIFAMHDVPVEKFMTPKHKISVFNEDAEVEDIVDAVARSTFSRFLIYRGRENNIVGFIYTNQLLDAINKSKRTIHLRKIMYPVRKVLASSPLESALTSMIKKRESIYVVYRKGTPSNIVGVITLKDILEKLVEPI